MKNKRLSVYNMFRSKYISSNKGKDAKTSSTPSIENKEQSITQPAPTPVAPAQAAPAQAAPTPTPTQAAPTPMASTSANNGFPKSKCSGIASLLSGECFVEGEKMTIMDATKEAGSDITNAIVHFGITTGAVGVNKVLDVLALALLGLDSVSINNKEDVIKKMEEKMLLLQHLATDEKSKRVIRKLFASLATIIMEGAEEARDPLIKSINSLNTVTVNGLNSVMRNASKFLKNAIKILPVVGDAYIILDNALVLAAAGTRIGSVAAKNAENMVSTADTIVHRVQNRVGPTVQEFGNNMEDLNKIRNDMNNASLSDVAENVETSVGKSIKSTGNSAANFIRRFTPKLRGGSVMKTKKNARTSALKSSIKKDTKTYKKKHVRFNLH
jgi:hypothetical protein